jgi:hypothetical protein
MTESEADLRTGNNRLRTWAELVPILAPACRLFPGCFGQGGPRAAGAQVSDFF